MAQEYPRREILTLYQDHPLNETALLARLREGRPDLRGLSAIDLAVDGEREITDQNHVGGFGLLRELTESLSLTERSRVLDVGSGLGGAARVIASLYGSRVDGVDLSPERCRTSETLNRLVGLEGFVNVLHGDILSVTLPVGAYDLVLGLDTFAHFFDKRRLVERCARALRPKGLLAVHEAYLAQPLASGEWGDEVRRLEEHWLACLTTVERWLGLLRSGGLTILVSEDLTTALIDHFETLIRVSVSPPARELAAWRLAVKLGRCGALRYARTIARNGNG